MDILLFIIIIALILFVIFTYWRVEKMLKSIDKMLDSAINDTFSERDFTESVLSKLEAKMYRYLSAGKTAKNQIVNERNTIKELVSDISHQTKTPLSNILIYTQLLQENDSLDSDSKELLSQIENQTEKLNFFIQVLVKTSRLENGIISVVPKETDILKIFDNIHYHTAAEKKGIALTFEKIPDLKAEFDLKWTTEAVSNIIENAIKYTPCGGSVTVSATDYEMFVRIDVTDTGIGINEEESAKIFSRFYRSARASSEKGVGIGLYLAREILTKEGGYIKVTSTPGNGSVFSIFLPKKSNLSKM